MSKYDSIKEQIKKDYKTTPKSLRQLAKEYNVSYDTVWTWSKKFNWTSSVTKIKTDRLYMIFILKYVIYYKNQSKLILWFLF